jgi:hypothetical protein
MHRSSQFVIRVREPLAAALHAAIPVPMSPGAGGERTASRNQSRALQQQPIEVPCAVEAQAAGIERTAKASGGDRIESSRISKTFINRILLGAC